MKSARFLTLTALTLLTCLPLLGAEEPLKAIPFDQLGAEAQKQYQGDGIGITPTAGGARLRAIMQRIEGEATAEGLWLTSTAEEDAGLVNRFRVRAVGMGRERSADTPVRSSAADPELRTGVSYYKLAFKPFFTCIFESCAGSPCGFIHLFYTRSAAPLRG